MASDIKISASSTALCTARAGTGLGSKSRLTRAFVSKTTRGLTVMGKNPGQFIFRQTLGCGLVSYLVAESLKLLTIEGAQPFIFSACSNNAP